MADLIIPQIFDPVQRKRARMRTARYSDDTRFLQGWTRRQIDDRLQDIKRDFDNPLILTPDCLITMEDEILNAAPGTHDLIISNLWLHSMNDLPGMLIQIKRALKPDGLFIGAMMGGETLRELREVLQITEIELMGGISPRVSPLADKVQMAGLMQRAGFALPVVDSDIITVTYPDLKKLMHDLRGMGETNILSERNKKIPSRPLFTRAEEIYFDKFREDEKLIASFEIIFLLGWAPHDSQQKPLKPGSAKTRLADALNTDETKL